MYGKKIKKIREAFNLSRNELADKIGISVVAVGKIENDQTNPSIDTIKNLSREFNINLKAFILNEGDLFEDQKITRVNNDKKINNFGLFTESVSHTSKDTLQNIDKNLSKNRLGNNIKRSLEEKLIFALENNRDDKKKSDRIIKRILKKIIKGNLTLKEFVEIVFDVK